MLLLLLPVVFPFLLPRFELSAFFRDLLGLSGVVLVLTANPFGIFDGLRATGDSNQRVIGNVNVVANSTPITSSWMSIAAAYNGWLPQIWGIVIENKTGGTLGAVTGSYQTIQLQQG